MQKPLAAAIAVCVLLCGIVRAEEAPEQPPTIDELDTVVVTGGDPIPRLWKVSKGDHVLWLAGNSWLRAGRVWRSDQVDAHVAESQVVIYPGHVDARPDVSIFKMVTLIPATLKAAKNPDGKTLKDVLPPEVYARWRVLKTTYVGRDDDIERWRPSIAIGMLESKVGKKMESSPYWPRPVAMGPPLMSVVVKAAKKHKVKTRTMPTVERRVQMKNVREIIKSAHHIDLGDGLCFAQSLGYLEQLIEYVKQRTAAPAAEIAPPRRTNCEDALIKGLRSGEIPDPAGARKVFDELELQLKLGTEQLDAEWMAAAQAAIAKNKSTFAVVSMNQVVIPTGYLAKLKELGYTVEEPK